MPRPASHDGSGNEVACAYIAQDSEAYARDFARRIVSAVDVLATFPAAGRVVPEFAQETLRELISGPYRVIYEIMDADVHILTVHHGARILRDRPR